VWAVPLFYFQKQTVMSEEQQQLQVSKLINKEVEIKRRVAWGEFGVVLYHG
jgi:hypothetical protein